MNDLPEADRIRRQMEHLRGELHDEYDAIVHGARVLSDWRYYAKSYPWACVAAAVAVGFLAVPKRLEVVSPSPEVLEELARRHKLVVEPKPQPQARGGLTAMLATLVANTAMRGLLAYAGQQTGKMFGGQQGAKRPQEVYPR